MSVIRKLYGVTDASLELPYDLVVPLEYGALSGRGKILPQATELCLSLAIQCIEEGKAKSMAWGSTDYFGPGASVLHEEKLKIIRAKNLPTGYVRAMVRSDNSIQEAQAISRACPDARRILVVCDWPHARRARMIWRHFYPEAEVGIVSLSAEWGEAHPSVWQKSVVRWIIGNMLHHFLITVRGIEKYSDTVHSVKTRAPR